MKHRTTCFSIKHAIYSARMCLCKLFLQYGMRDTRWSICSLFCVGGNVCAYGSSTQKVLWYSRGSVAWWLQYRKESEKRERREKYLLHPIEKDFVHNSKKGIFLLCHFCFLNSICTQSTLNMHNNIRLLNIRHTRYTRMLMFEYRILPNVRCARLGTVNSNCIPS